MTRDSRTSVLGVGRTLIAAVAVITIVSPTLVDLNETHIYNPEWSAHAKFHVAHTMTLGVVLGVIALGYLYLAPRRSLAPLRTATLVVTAYWVAQAAAILVPRTAFADPEHADRLPTIAGLTIIQPVLDAVLVGITLTGYAIEARALSRPVA